MKILRDKAAAALIAAGLWLMHGSTKHYTYSLRWLPNGVLRFDTWPKSAKIDVSVLVEGDPEPRKVKRQGPNHPDVEGRGW